MKSEYADGVMVGLQLGDLAIDDFHHAIEAREVGWDIETSGLDWRECDIGTCQLSIGKEKVVIVQVKGCVPERLGRLLANEGVCKVFHHAIFDLRFMVHKWHIQAANVACTKIASKLVDPDKHDHSLKALLQEHLQVEIDKSERVSNWMRDRLTRKQLSYATQDVRYLLPLLRRLQEELEIGGRLPLAQACFAHIPTRVQLDIDGYGDIYEY